MPILRPVTEFAQKHRVEGVDKQTRFRTALPVACPLPFPSNLLVPFCLCKCLPCRNSRVYTGSFQNPSFQNVLQVPPIHEDHLYHYYFPQWHAPLLLADFVISISCIFNSLKAKLSMDLWFLFLKSSNQWYHSQTLLWFQKTCKAVSSLALPCA